MTSTFSFSASFNLPWLLYVHDKLAMLVLRPSVNKGIGIMLISPSFFSLDVTLLSVGYYQHATCQACTNISYVSWLWHLSCTSNEHKSVIISHLFLVSTDLPLLPRDSYHISFLVSTDLPCPYYISLWYLASCQLPMET